MDFKDVYKYSYQENLKQKKTLSLIASENRIYKEALFLSKYSLSDKYAEGYPGRRFYSGCQNIDEIENLCIQAATKLFDCKYANVQCLSGSIANFAIYQAFLEIGDTILSMEISSGGHLTHSSKLSFVSKLYKVETYSVNQETLRIDYEEVLKIAKKIKPKLVIVGGSSYPFQICFKTFRHIADSVGAYLFADICHLSSLIATGLHPHCFPFAHVAMFTTHKQMRGSRGAVILWNDDKFTSIINKSVFPGIQGGMNPLSLAQNAVALIKNLDIEFKDYVSDVVNSAKLMCSIFKEKKVKVIGTDTHMFLIDTQASFGLTGKEAADILSESGLLTNPNLLPFDTKSPSITSGIRLGTLFLCTLKPTNREIIWISDWMYKILSSGKSSLICRREISEWMSKAYER